jgi:hypothetical protein
MSKAFNQAFNLSVVEEKHREAIDLCRKALEVEPDNYRVLVFVGILLGDHPSELLLLDGELFPSLIV